MKEAYIIVDSDGNVSKDNLHTKDNNLLKQSFGACLYKLGEANEKSISKNY